MLIFTAIPWSISPWDEGSLNEACFWCWDQRENQGEILLAHTLRHEFIRPVVACRPRINLRHCSLKVFDRRTSIIWWSSNPFVVKNESLVCSRLVDYMSKSEKKMQAWRDIDWSVVNAYELLFDSNKHLVFHLHRVLLFERIVCIACYLMSAFVVHTRRRSSRKNRSGWFFCRFVYFPIDWFKIRIEAWEKEINVCIQKKKTRLENERERESARQRDPENKLKLEIHSRFQLPVMCSVNVISRLRYVILFVLEALLSMGSFETTSMKLDQLFALSDDYYWTMKQVHFDRWKHVYRENLKSVQWSLQWVLVHWLV